MNKLSVLRAKATSSTCYVTYVKNERRSTRAALSCLIDAVNGEVHNLLVAFVL